MKKNIIDIICIVFLCLTVQSCKKFLNEKQDKSLVTPTTLDDLQAILDDESNMNRKTPSFGESSADDYFLTSSTYNSLTERNKSVYRWIPYNYHFPNDWSMNYFIVYNTNLCLERVQDVARDVHNAEAWDNIKGSSLFYRAYSFLNLAWIYSKAYNDTSADTSLGIVLRSGSDFNVPSSRSTVKETYNKIISDAREAALYLPSTPLHVMRPSKAAAHGLLARAFLSMAKYDSAYKYSNLCLQEKNYLMDYNDNPFINNLSENIPFRPFNPEIIFYSELNTNLSLHSPLSGKIDSVLYQTYHLDDLRKLAFFRSSGGYQRFKGSYSSSTVFLFSGLATDEMFLIRAESHARLGRPQEAMNDLNLLIEKRWSNLGSFVPYSASDVSSALNIILLERRKELLMRGIRWSDIKRLNLEGLNLTLKRSVDNQTFSLTPNDIYYALPLPMDIIHNSQIKQN